MVSSDGLPGHLDDPLEKDHGEIAACWPSCANSLRQVRSHLIEMVFQLYVTELCVLTFLNDFRGSIGSYFLSNRIGKVMFMTISAK